MISTLLTERREVFQSLESLRDALQQGLGSMSDNTENFLYETICKLLTEKSLTHSKSPVPLDEMAGKLISNSLRGLNEQRELIDRFKAFPSSSPSLGGDSPADDVPEYQSINKALMARIQQLESEQAHDDAVRDTVQAHVQSIEQKLSSVCKERDALQTQIRDRDKKLREIRAQGELVAKQVNMLADQKRALQEELKEEQRQNFDLQNEVDRLVKAIQVLHREQVNNDTRQDAADKIGASLQSSLVRAHDDDSDTDQSPSDSALLLHDQNAPLARHMAELMKQRDALARDLSESNRAYEVWLAAMESRLSELMASERPRKNGGKRRGESSENYLDEMDSDGSAAGNGLHILDKE
jgi:chromosome segregation ATPase